MQMADRRRRASSMSDALSMLLAGNSGRITLKQIEQRYTGKRQ
jgi:hypothetical protein